MIINAENSNNIDYNLFNTLINPIIKHCPYCTCTYFIKYGFFNNNQRYMCKECCRTFCVTTNTPLYHSRKPIEYWIKFIELMFNNTSLRDSSKEIKIGLKISFAWRHKLLCALDSFCETNKLKDCIEMRKIFIRDNDKGNKSNSLCEGKKVWVIISSDSNDDAFAKPISLGLWRRKNFDKFVYSKINKSSYIRTFGDSYIKAIAKIHNKGKLQKINSKSMDLINNFTGNIKSIISKCHGVATKYLPHYFSLAKFISLDKKNSALDILTNILNSNTYISANNLKEIVPIFQSQ